MILAYCHATLQDDTLDTITPFLQQKGVGIVAASALSMGLLSNRVCPLRFLPIGHYPYLFVLKLIFLRTALLPLLDSAPYCTASYLHAEELCNARPHFSMQSSKHSLSWIGTAYKPGWLTKPVSDLTSFSRHVLKRATSGSISDACKSGKWFRVMEPSVDTMIQ